MSEGLGLFLLVAYIAAAILIAVFAPKYYKKKYNCSFAVGVIAQIPAALLFVFSSGADSQAAHIIMAIAAVLIFVGVAIYNIYNTAPWAGLLAALLQFILSFGIVIFVLLYIFERSEAKNKRRKRRKKI